MGNDFVILKKESEKAPDLYIKVEVKHAQSGEVERISYIKVKNRNAVLIYFMTVDLLSVVLTSNITVINNMSKPELYKKLLMFILSIKPNEYYVDLDAHTKIDIGIIMLGAIALMFPSGDYFPTKVNVGIVTSDNLSEEVVIKFSEYKNFQDMTYGVFTRAIADGGITEKSIISYHFGKYMYLTYNHLYAPTDYITTFKKDVGAELEIISGRVYANISYMALNNKRYMSSDYIDSLTTLHELLLSGKVVRFIDVTKEE